MALLWRGIGGAERLSGRGRGRRWAKNSSSLISLLVQPSGATLSDELAKDLFLDQTAAGINATLNQTLESLVSASAGDVDISANLGGQLGTLTLSATSTLSSNAINGELSATLGALTLSATAKLNVAGQIDSTLGALTGSSTGDVDLTASLAGQLAPLTATATARLGLSGQVNQPLGNLSLSATGLLGNSPIEGQLNVTLGALTLLSVGSIAQQSQEPQFIGDGYKAYERVAKERRERDEDLKRIIRVAYDKVMGVENAVGAEGGEGISVVATPSLSRPAMREIADQAKRVAQQQGIWATLEKIKSLVREIERELTAQVIREEDELMMVLLAA